MKKYRQGQEKHWVAGCVFVFYLWAGASHAAAHDSADYATDFAQCSQHFLHQKPPVTVFDLSGKEQYPLCFIGFATLYSGVSHTALYSAHHLTRGDVIQARQLSREDSFRPEERLPIAHQVTLQDYKRSGFDRGHLVPNGDMSDRKKQYDSFSLANIIPQNKENNRGIWRQIESHTRNLTSKYGESYIVTGVAFAGSRQKLASMTIPSHIYKAVYLPSANIAAVYYAPNNASGSYELITPEVLRDRIGVDVFPATDSKFAPREFDLDGRDDRSQTQASADNFNLWTLLKSILVALWQALA